jgi:hypothetical protein
MCLLVCRSRFRTQPPGAGLVIRRSVKDSLKDSCLLAFPENPNEMVSASTMMPSCKGILSEIVRILSPPSAYQSAPQSPMISFYDCVVLEWPSQTLAIRDWTLRCLCQFWTLYVHCEMQLNAKILLNAEDNTP